MKKEIKVEITELFTAKADSERCFHGIIKRQKDENGNYVVRGKIKVNDGFIYAMADDQWKLSEKLDQLVLMILDHNLHESIGIIKPIAGTSFFLN
jgi:hypothetical protein